MRSRLFKTTVALSVATLVLSTCVFSAPPPPEEYDQEHVLYYDGTGTQQMYDFHAMDDPCTIIMYLRGVADDMPNGTNYDGDNEILSGHLEGYSPLELAEYYDYRTGTEYWGYRTAEITYQNATIPNNFTMSLVVYQETAPYPHNYRSPSPHDFFDPSNTLFRIRIED